MSGIDTVIESSGTYSDSKTGFGFSRASVKYVFNAETTLFRLSKLPKRANISAIYVN